MSTHFGYAGNILRVDLSSGKVTNIPTRDYTDRFIGGQGVAAKLYWDEVPPHVKALDPENRLIFVNGPMAGFTGVAGSIWQIHGKSPATIPEHFCYASLAGSWGAQLKFAGYDGVVIQGRAEKPVCLLIENGTARTGDASSLWGKDSVSTRETLKRELGKSAKVAAIGPAGENMVSFATVFADDDASGSCGMGAVMGSKNLKAIVVRGQRKPVAAHPGKLRELRRRLLELTQGTSILPDFGFVASAKMKKQACYGCIRGCIRAIFEASNGKRGKYMCQSGIYYQYRAHRYYGEWNEVPFYANRLCDEHGLDTRVVETMIAWLVRCYRAGILTDENTAIPLSKLGSLEFIETLVKKVSFREGFGDILARGTMGAASAMGDKAKALVTDYVIDGSGQVFENDPRMYIATGLLQAMQPRQHATQAAEITRPVAKWQNWRNKVEGAYVSPEVLRAIGRRFFGDETALDFSTYDGKALAAKRAQDRFFARENLILCSFAWPIVDALNSEDHVGDPTLESRVFSAVTGRGLDEEGLSRTGEVVFNLCRAILVREGHRGRESDVLPQVFYTRPFEAKLPLDYSGLVPGRRGEATSRKGAVIDREKFERMKDEYYRLRQWDVASGLPTKAKLEELGLQEVAKDLGQRGLAI